MKLKSVFIGSAAVTALAVAAPNAVTHWSLVAPAQAATNVSISINTFYNDLDSHGDWIRHNGIYVFVPIGVSDGWRPYTVGHWVFTRQYGWMWVSDEPFGWATYHYGRWGYADDIGWYWVPGTKWAPAWVSWRRSEGYIAWAPLPPPRRANVVVDFSYGEVPDYYWTPVPTRSFLEINLSVVIVKDRRERDRIVRSAEPAGEVTVQNNIVVNNVIDVDFIKKETKKDVKVVEVKETDQPRNASKAEGDSVTVFQGDVQAEADAKPAKAKDAEEVKQIQAKRRDKPTENAAETTAKEGQPAAGESQSGEQKPEGQQPEQQTGEQPGKEKKQQQTGEQPQHEKKKQQDTSEQPPAVDETQQGAGEPLRKEKKHPELTGEQPPAQDQTGASAKDEQPPSMEDITGSTKPAPEGAGQPRQREEGKPGKKQGECDPSADPNCAPQ